MITFLIILVTAAYVIVGAIQFMNGATESSMGIAFGWFGTPLYITFIRAMFWPLFLFLGVVMAIWDRLRGGE